MRGRYVFFGLLAGLILAEVTLRTVVGLGDPPRVLMDEAVEYRLVPNQVYSRFGNRIAVNSQGMRAEEFAQSAGASERRVMLVGDSVIYGNHFLSQHETIAYRMAERLERDAPACRMTVMPAAASSWGPVNQAAFIAEIGTLDADVALIVVSAHDLFDVPSPDVSLIPYRTRRSFGALDDAAQAVLARVERSLSSPSPDSANLDARRISSLAAMDAMLAQFRADGVPVILVYHPTLPERRDGLSAAYDGFADWARQRSVDVVLLEDASTVWADVYRDNIHPEAQGADIIADILAKVALPILPEC